MPDDSQRLDLALGWLQRRRESFSFRHGRSSRDRLILLKPFAELLLTHTVLHREATLRDRLLDDVEWAWGECDQGETVLTVLQARPDLFELITIYGSFAELGYTNHNATHWLNLLFTSPGAAGELAAWRRAALHYHLAQLGFRPASDRLDDQSWLFERPDPWTLSVDRLYATTHHIFYLTDFGRHPNRLDARIRAYLDLWMPVWAAHVQGQQNWDLLGELVLVGLCVEHSELVSEFAPILFAMQHEDGSFPAVPGTSATLADYSTLDDAGFYSVYHPTLVAIMTLAVKRQRNKNDQSLLERHHTGERNVNVNAGSSASSASTPSSSRYQARNG